MREFHRRLALLLLALPLTCAGCIEGNVQYFFRYDPKADSFSFLNVYTNLNATSTRMRTTSHRSGSGAIRFSSSRSMGCS